MFTNVNESESYTIGYDSSVAMTQGAKSFQNHYMMPCYAPACN